MKIGVLLMAAGNSRRFQGNKLEALYEGKSLIQRALQVVPQNVCCLVVSQYEEVLKQAKEYGFQTAWNHHPDWGISHTIAIGVEYLADCDGIVFLVADQPKLTKNTVKTLISMFSPENIVAVSHNGKRGNPCLFPRKFYQELSQLEGDTGGNQVIRNHMQNLELIEIPGDQLEDVDTRAQLNTL